MALGIPVSTVIMRVAVLGVVIINCYAESRYADCRYAECRCAGAYKSGALTRLHTNGRLINLPTNRILGWQCMAVTNTLAY